MFHAEARGARRKPKHKTNEIVRVFMVGNTQIAMTVNGEVIRKFFKTQYSGDAGQRRLLVLLEELCLKGLAQNG